jgi:hypothetical protein
VVSVVVFGTAMSGAPRASEVVVHEWGTFTTVAGEDGRAVNWLPLGGPVDLPCFVQCYKNRQIKFLAGGEQDGPIDYETARSTLVGTVRMETPVLYFYAPEETTVSVRVRFPRGLMTEWYPAATVSQPDVVPTVLDNPNVVGAIDWPRVRITPDRQPIYPTGSGTSHYYAARHTDASPVQVDGQDEKFLFYRGVASFPSLVSAALDQQNHITVSNLGAHPISSVILFENRAGRISYRQLDGALARTATIARPTSPARFDDLRRDLAAMLVGTGLFQKEAEAMIETWRDSWFEEGTRVFYLVPPKAVDDILPLTVAPAPAAISRAFVGRMEIITPETLIRVQTAINMGDMEALGVFARFLGPITDRLAARTSSVSDRSRLRALANSMFAAYVKSVGACK